MTIEVKATNTAEKSRVVTIRLSASAKYVTGATGERLAGKTDEIVVPGDGGRSRPIWWTGWRAVESLS